MLCECFLLLDTPDEKLAFETVYYTYRNQMYRIANSILNDAHLAEDAVAEAFLSIARHFSRFQGIDGPSRIGYITIVTRNHAITLYRKRKRLDELYGIPPSMPAEEYRPELHEKDLRQAMGELPEKYKDVLMLKYHYCFSVKEIADLLCLNLETTRSRLQTARRLVHPLLQQRVEAEEETEQIKQCCK